MVGKDEIGVLEEGFVDGDNGGGDVEAVFVAHDWVEDCPTFC